ncbi:hypothetical protein E1B28_010783 [Marasmius oreades]|uniref:Uncharacterized protein n=1 Tax=Marasmius oreades TaxID=181124 RepID=A0A9P7UPB2_9AGAR|nr:uncharacterized protein E1B28_010783 [Marasmius oreades]KAG7089073.1 hypothetical protein E1B28_010783 [Marasmius oreades]
MEACSQELSRIHSQLVGAAIPIHLASKAAVFHLMVVASMDAHSRMSGSLCVLGLKYPPVQGEISKKKKTEKAFLACEMATQYRAKRMLIGTMECWKVIRDGGADSYPAQ